jgi:hypothetical protein
MNVYKCQKNARFHVCSSDASWFSNDIHAFLAISNRSPAKKKIALLQKKLTLSCVQQQYQLVFE